MKKVKVKKAKSNKVDEGKKALFKGNVENAYVRLVSSIEQRTAIGDSICIEDVISWHL